MERQAVTSSNLKEVGFDPATNTLEILFSDGRLYQYFDVPEQVFSGLLSATSAGQYFHAQIRGTYRFARL